MFEDFRGIDTEDVVRLPDPEFEEFLGLIVSEMFGALDEQFGPRHPAHPRPYGFGVKARVLELSRLALDAGDPGTAFALLVVAVQHGVDRGSWVSRALFRATQDLPGPRASPAERFAAGIGYAAGCIAGVIGWVAPFAAVGVASAAATSWILRTFFPH